jgi:pimeloyl-ACP methyl ester carboxylesterase
VERDGVRVGYEVSGAGEPAILLLTSWAIVHARRWKAQVPYLARRFRVITVERRGHGRAGRPVTTEALSLGGRPALPLAAWYPERAAGVIAIGAALPWPSCCRPVGPGNPAVSRSRAALSSLRDPTESFRYTLRR